MAGPGPNRRQRLPINDVEFQASFHATPFGIVRVESDQVGCQRVFSHERMIPHQYGIAAAVVSLHGQLRDTGPGTPEGRP